MDFLKISSHAVSQKMILRSYLIYDLYKIRNKFNTEVSNFLD